MSSLNIHDSNSLNYVNLISHLLSEESSKLNVTIYNIGSDLIEGELNLTQVSFENLSKGDKNANRFAIRLLQEQESLLLPEDVAQREFEFINIISDEGVQKLYRRDVSVIGLSEEEYEKITGVVFRALEAIAKEHEGERDEVERLGLKGRVIEREVRPESVEGLIEFLAKGMLVRLIEVERRAVERAREEDRLHQESMERNEKKIDERHWDNLKEDIEKAEKKRSQK